MASVTKQVYFNIEGDRELLEYANALPSFSTWVKAKIRDEVNRGPEPGAELPSGGEPRKKLVWNLK